MGIQARGGLVQDQNAGIGMHTPENLHQLFASRAQRRGGRAHVGGKPSGLAGALGRAVEKIPVYQAGATGKPMVWKHVLGDGEVIEDGEFLLDHGDANLTRASRCMHGDPSSLEHESPRTRLNLARHDLDERALPGTILPKNGVNLPGADLERDIVQGAVEPRLVGIGPGYFFEIKYCTLVLSTTTVPM